jgi:fluoroquinolone transport system ATP-binding protein
MIMIKAQNLFYSYGKTNQYQVNDVSFEVKDGEIFGFLGPMAPANPPS